MQTSFSHPAFKPPFRSGEAASRYQCACLDENQNVTMSFEIPAADPLAAYAETMARVKDRSYVFMEIWQGGKRLFVRANPARYAAVA